MDENKLPTREELKSYFKTGKYPTQSQFSDFIDSYWHKKEDTLPEETLATVINRNNVVPEQGIKLVHSATSPSTKIELRVNHKTWSPWIGNMNPDHTGVYNHSFGYGALQDVTSGDGNVALGNHALWKLTTGIRNTVVGSSSMIALKEGYWNVVVGQATLYYFATGHNNTAVGRVAMNNFIGGYGNTALGSHSGYVDGGTKHTQEYNYNTFLGFRSGYTSDLPNNLKGNNNVTIGSNAPIGGNTNNKLVIHSSEAVLNHNTTLPLIGGDFVERTLDFDSSLKVHRLPQADSTFTKNIVAKSDGTFGWENKSSGGEASRLSFLYGHSGSEIDGTIADIIQLWNQERTITIKNNPSNEKPYWIMMESASSDYGVIKIKAEAGRVISIDTKTGYETLQQDTTYRLKSGKRYLVSKRHDDNWLIIYEF
ncbi:hypothetical protein GCM10023210_04120 [Chryseobacterium ginsengisoli]|uniref:Uncharacterized protein n=1 Tax=Chryseobacterium ginsengisoli TaxID=363853 RepID=A0ABP9LTE5_9FLAO